MSKLKRMIVGAACAALAISALAAPTSAATESAKVVLVQGIPGAKAEVCVSGKELRKVFRYGQFLRAKLEPGTYRIALRTAAPGRCRGALLARKQLVLTGSERLTVVASYHRGGRAMLVFDDREALAWLEGEAFPTIGLFQHAARLGRLDLFVASPLSPGSADTSPTVPGVRKGQQQGGPTEPGSLVLWVNRAGTDRTVIGPRLVQMREDKINHLVAVGTHPYNARFVFFRTAIDG